MDAFGVFGRDGELREEAFNPEPWVDAPNLHGGGESRGVAVAHEKRHVRVASGLNIRTNGYRVWKEGDFWAGVTYLDKSAANMRRWNALSSAEQAAVYMAGAMGPRGEADGCSDDLAAVDSLSSRGAARAVARRYL